MLQADQADDRGTDVNEPPVQTTPTHGGQQLLGGCPGTPRPRVGPERLCEAGRLWIVLRDSDLTERAAEEPVRAGPLHQQQHTQEGPRRTHRRPSQRRGQRPPTRGYRFRRRRQRPPGRIQRRSNRAPPADLRGPGPCFGPVLLSQLLPEELVAHTARPVAFARWPDMTMAGQRDGRLALEPSGREVFLAPFVATGLPERRDVVPGWDRRAARSMRDLDLGGELHASVVVVLELSGEDSRTAWGPGGGATRRRASRFRHAAGNGSSGASDGFALLHGGDSGPRGGRARNGLRCSRSCRNRRSGPKFRSRSGAAFWSGGSGRATLRFSSAPGGHGLRRRGTRDARGIGRRGGRKGGRSHSGPGGRGLRAVGPRAGQWGGGSGSGCTVGEPTRQAFDA